MEQSHESKPSLMSDENRKSLRLFRLLSVLAMVAAVGAATSFGLVLRPFLAWDADRVGAERRAKERLSDLEEAASVREEDLTRVFAEKSSAMESRIAVSKRRLDDIESLIQTAIEKRELAESQATQAGEELVSIKAEIATFEPSLVEGRQKRTDLQSELQRLQTAVDSMIAESNRVAVLNAVACVNLTNATERYNAIQHVLGEWEQRVRDKTDDLRTIEGQLRAIREDVSVAKREQTAEQSRLAELRDAIHSCLVQLDAQTNLLYQVRHEVDELKDIRARLNQIVGRYSVWTNQAAEARAAADREVQRLAELEGRRDAIRQEIRDAAIVKGERDEVIRQRDEAIRQRDEAIRQREEAVRQRDEAIRLSDEIRVKRTHKDIDEIFNEGSGTPDSSGNVSSDPQSAEEMQ